MPTEIDVTVQAPAAVGVELTSFLTDLYTLRSFGANMNATFNKVAASFDGTDDTAYLQDLVNAQGSIATAPEGPSADYDYTGANASNTTQGVAELPRGAHLVVNGTITIPPGVRVRGNGAVLIRTSAANPTAPMFQCAYVQSALPGGTGDTYSSNSGNVIEDLTLWGPGTTVSQGAAIQMIACQGFQLKNVYIAGFYVGIDLQACQYFSIDFVFSQNCVHGLIMRAVPGNTFRCIDGAVRNSRFAKTVGGYGVWLQDATNISFDQIDANFCSKAALVCGGALPDYVSRTLAFTPGAGYTPNSTYPLAFANTGQTLAPTTQLSGIALSNANGQITAAYMTDCIGDGTGIAQNGLTITVGTTPIGSSTASSPTTAANITPSVQRDATAFASWISSSQIETGLIRLNNFKTEAGVAPDCGYLVFVNSRSAANFYNTKLSGIYLSQTNFYRGMYCAGNVDAQFGEFPGPFANPANPADFGSFRCVNSNMRVVLPLSTSTTNFSMYVIAVSGGSALSGEGVFLQITEGDAVVQPHIKLINNAFGGNPRIEIALATDAQNRFQIDGGGALYWGPGGTIAVDTMLARSAAGVLQLNGLSITPGYAAIQTLSGSGTLADFVTTVVVHGGTLTLSVPSVDASAIVARQVRVYCWFQTQSILVAPPSGGSLYYANNMSGNLTVNQGTSVLLQYANGNNWIQVG